MIHSLRSIHLALILIVMSAPHISLSMNPETIKGATAQQLIQLDCEAVCTFTKNLYLIDPTELIFPENYSKLSVTEKADFLRYRIDSLSAFFGPCNLLLNNKNPGIRTVLVDGCARIMDASQLEKWATHTISVSDSTPETAKNLAYIKEIAHEALQLKAKNNSSANNQNLPLPNLKQTLSFFAKCSIASVAIGTVALAYYWYTAQKKTQKA